MRASLLLAGLLTVTVLAGCVGDDADPAGATRASGYDTTRGWSMPLSPALYEILPGEKIFVESHDGTLISLGLFFPEIEGCDWDADDLPEECLLPAVMDAGPYWGDHVEGMAYRPPTTEWLVPRGYVKVQMSVRGTGESGGCMEFMSPAAQADVDSMITWISEQSWSNGNVGMMGRSYDGTTPFWGAAAGNPALKAIVPIAGVPDPGGLMFRNGTVEDRGPVMHSTIYWTWFGLGTIDGGVAGYRAEHHTEQACQEFVDGLVEGHEAMVTGDIGTQYWQERDVRQAVLDNYQGAIWIVHGMEDWNVNPSQVVPWLNELIADPDIDTRAWLGVWDHAYPDRVDEHRNVRWDWADETVKWFDYYLKDKGDAPPLRVEVEDRLFVWRQEANFPPLDAEWVEFGLGADLDLAEPGMAAPGTFQLLESPADAMEGPLYYADMWAYSAQGLAPAPIPSLPRAPYDPPLSVPGVAGTSVGFASEPLEDDLRISGLPQLHITATPTSPQGGAVFAELYDLFPDGHTWRIGWSAMDVRYHAGGNTDPATLTPGEPVLMKMEFEPVDAHVGEGHRLLLVLHRAGVEDIVASPVTEPTGLTLGDGSATLRLPSLQRDEMLVTYMPPELSP